MAMGGYQWTPIAIPLLWTLDITDISFVPRHHAHARARTHAHDLASPESDAVMSKEVHKKKHFLTAMRFCGWTLDVHEKRELSNGKTREHLQVG